MRISITGRHIDLGESLESYISAKLENSLLKILQNIDHAEVIFSKNSYKYLARIIITEGHSLGTIGSNFESDEIYHSFDGALIKLEKQLRKHKEKYKDHQARKLAEISSGANEDIAAKKYVISTATADQASNDNDQPLIIAEKAMNIEALEVSEAVMKMDLTHVPALLFKNKSNGRINLVFYRADGNISWIDPEV